MEAAQCRATAADSAPVRFPMPCDCAGYAANAVFELKCANENGVHVTSHYIAQWRTLSIRRCAVIAAPQKAGPYRRD